MQKVKCLKSGNRSHLFVKTGSDSSTAKRSATGSGAMQLSKAHFWKKSHNYDLYSLQKSKI